MTSANPQNVAQEYFFPGEFLTYKVGATPITNPKVNGQVSAQLVELSADRTVIPAQAGSTVVVGIAQHEGDASGIFTVVTVASAGVWPLKAAANITAGQRLKAAAAGTVTPFVANADGTVARPDAIVAIALEAIASGAIGRCKLINLG